jgi:hypothetical protein
VSGAADRRSVTAGQLAAGLSIISFAVALGLNVGLSVVLERSGAAALPGLTLLNGLLLGGATATVSVLGRGVAARSLGLSLALAAALVAVAALGDRAAPRWSAGALYLVASVLGDLSAALFWSLANELYDARTAKQVFPRVGAAGTAGAAIAGLVARAAGDALGARGLLALWIASLLASAVWALRLALRARTALPGAHVAAPRRGLRGGAGPARARPEDAALVRALAIGFVLVISVTSVGRFLYSASLAEVYGADAVAIAKLNGGLNAFASVATAPIQLLVTPLLLARWGIRGTMFVYPVSLALVFCLLGVHPGLAAGVAAFFVTSVVRRAVQGPVESVLPTGLVPADASRAVLLLTAIGAPAGMLLAGGGLMLGRSGHTRPVVVLGLVLAALLVVVAAWRARAYRSALRLRLAKGGSDLHALLLGSLAVTHDARSLMVEQLDPGDPQLVERLRTVVRARRQEDAGPRPWDPRGPLARIVLARIAEAYRLHGALARLPASGGDGAIELLRGAIRHRLADGVLAVILALQAATGERDLDRISRRIFDRDPRARSAAVEILDVLCPPDLRGLFVPLVEQVGIDAAAEKAARRFGPPGPDPIEDLLEVPDPWLHACAIYALGSIRSIDPARYRARLEALRPGADPFVAVAIAHALGEAAVSAP